MKRLAMMVVAAAAWAVSPVAAQTGGSEDARRTYYALGVEAGGELDFCDEDNDCSDGGFGAFGRVGYRANRFLGLEADFGVAALGGNGEFVHAAGLGVLTLPVGPVELRARGGLAVFNADGDARLGGALGPGLGVRLGRRSALRADVLVFIAEDARDSGSADAGGLFQVGYERRF